MTKTIGVTLDDLGYGSSLEVWVEYEYTPAEPMVWRYSDGSGYPGFPATAELRKTRVFRWDCGDEERLRSDHWIWAELDEIAYRLIEYDWEWKFEPRCIEDAEQEEYEQQFQPEQ